MRLFYKLLTLFLLISVTGYSQSNCWEQVWADEFEVNGLPDSEKWGYDLGGGGWGNNELQTYTKNLENARVEGGNLIITALKENNSWTSARLVSREKGDWLYGRIEVKAKLPAAARGTWSAIWMLPTDWEYGNWPKSGEIDIMENVGYDPLDVVGTVHTEAYNHGKNTQKGATIAVPDNASAFHVYAVEWYKDSILFLVDNTIYHRFKNEYKTFAEWPFDKRHHLLLNIAMGGNWGGLEGIDATLTKAEMVIDYVRVFQNGSTMALSGDTSAVKSQGGLVFRAPYSENFTYSWEVPADAQLVGSSTDSAITVQWGCQPGIVLSKVTGACETFNLEHNVSIKDPQVTGKMFVGTNETGVAFKADSIPNTIYTWTVPAGVTITEGAGTDKIKVTWNNTSGIVSVKMSNTCGDYEPTFKTYIKGQYPYPDLDTPHAIPGEIDATHYDYGGEGVAYHDATAINEGPGIRSNESVDTEFGDNSMPNVGWITSGEWLKYTVKVTKTNWYAASIRAGSAGAADSFSISFNDETKFKAIKIKPTGSWSVFTEQNIGKAYLEAGEYVMTYNFHKGGYNVGKLKFSETTAPATPPVDPPTGIEDKFPKAELYPNPSTGKLYVSGVANISYIKVIDALGHAYKVPFSKESERLYLVNLEKLPKGIYMLHAKSGKDILLRKVILK